MNKNFNQLVTATLLTITLVFATQNYGMNNFRQRFMPGWKTAALGLISGGLTVGHYYIFLKPSISSLPFNGDRIAESMPNLKDINPGMDSLIRKKLEEVGVEVNDTVRIKADNTNNNCMLIGYKYNYICLDPFVSYFNLPQPEFNPHNHNDPQKYLEDHLAKLTDEEISQFLYKDMMYKSAIIQHEGTHLHNKHALKEKAAALIIPCAIEAFCFGSRRYMPLKSQGFVIKNLLKIPKGILKSLICRSLYVSYTRHLEQEADNNIQGIDELIAIRDYFQLIRNDLKLFEPSKFRNHEKRTWPDFHTHPTHKQRIAQFDRQIAAIEALNYHPNPLETQAPQNPLDRKESESK